MRSRYFWSLALLLGLAVEPGCRERSPATQEDAGSGPNQPDRTHAGAEEPAPVVEPPRLFPRTPPGRGLGRMLGGRGAGRRLGARGFLELAPEEVQRLGIVTAKAGSRSVQALHSAVGKVLAPPPRMAKVSYPFPARISAIHAQLGDWVEQGQPVLTLESEEVGRACSEFYKARADLELARRNYEREERLAGRGVGARKNLLAAGAALKVAEAALDAAEKKLHVLGFSEDDVRLLAETHQVNPQIRILAPIRGRVIEQKAILGAIVEPTAELMTIMDPTWLWVEAEVFEQDIARVRVGQPVEVTVLAYPGEIFRGKVTYLGEAINPETRTLSVRTEVENREFKLKPGMFAEVRILLGSRQRAVMVPEEAVLGDGDRDIVFVNAGGRYVPRAVRVGGRQQGYCAIAEGLQEGEEVVVKNAYLLKSKLYDEALRAAGVH